MIKNVTIAESAIKKMKSKKTPKQKKNLTPIYEGSDIGQVVFYILKLFLKQPTKDQKKILKDFQNSIENNANHNPLKDEWFDKVKSFFDSK